MTATGANEQGQQIRKVYPKVMSELLAQKSEDHSQNDKPLAQKS